VPAAVGIWLKVRLAHRGGDVSYAAGRCVFPDTYLQTPRSALPEPPADDT